VSVPNVHVQSVLDSNVSRAVYDIRIYAQDPSHPNQYLLTFSADAVESNGPGSSLAFVAPCMSAPAPGRPGKIELSVVAYGPDNLPLGPRQTQTQLYVCLGKSENFSGDNIVPPFVFTIVAELDRGFADITVLLVNLALTFKVDVTRLLLAPTGNGAARAKTAVTGLIATRGHSAGSLPDLYVLARDTTSATCLACGPGATNGPLQRGHYAGVESATLGNEQGKYLNSAWQMPEGAPFTTDGDWDLEAFALVFRSPGAGLHFVQGGFYVAYRVRSTFNIGYVDEATAQVHTATALGHLADSAGSRHVYLVRNAAARMGLSQSRVPGFELVYKQFATADTHVATFDRKQFYAALPSGAPRPTRAVSARPVLTSETRFLVFLADDADPDDTIIGAARCEVGALAANCNVGPDGALIVEPVTAELLAGLQ
jgi:hypothetical protein